MAKYFLPRPPQLPLLSSAFSRFPKSQLRAARRTAWKWAQPDNVRRVWLKADGTPTTVGTR